MTLVERVARRICESTDGPWEFHDQYGHAAYEVQARACIAAVFDWLAEPGYSAIDAGLECGPDRDCETYWTAMLAAMRKEAWGD